MGIFVNIKKRTVRRLVYLFGAIIEVLGLALLFSFDKTMNYIHSSPIFYSLILVIGGYIIAVGARQIK